MRISIIRVGFLSAILALALAGQNATAANTIQVSATGSVSADPDTAVVSINIEGRSADATAAYTEAQTQATLVRALLTGQGFTSAQAHWSRFSVQPEFDYQPPARRITGYVVSAALELDLTDFAKIGPLINAINAKGIQGPSGVRFELKNQDAAKSEAIANGYREARQEAEALARAAGKHLDALSYATVDVARPQAIMAYAAAGPRAMAPAPTESFSPQTITVTANITAVYRILP
ncbi:MAG TPA: SIMPL domain-containing protein [Terriglobales bacterium]|jgi:hypothetical protein